MHYITSSLDKPAIYMPMALDEYDCKFSIQVRNLGDGFDLEIVSVLPRSHELHKRAQKGITHVPHRLSEVSSPDPYTRTTVAVDMVPAVALSICI